MRFHANVIVSTLLFVNLVRNIISSVRASIEFSNEISREEGSRAIILGTDEANVSAKVRGARKEEKSPRGRLPIYPFLVRLVSLLRLSSLPDCLPSPAYRVPARPDKFRSLNLKCLATSARDRSETLSARNGRSRRLSLLGSLVFHPEKLVPAKIFRFETWKIRSIFTSRSYINFPTSRRNQSVLGKYSNCECTERSHRGKSCKYRGTTVRVSPDTLQFISLSFEQIPGTSRG